MSPNQAFDSLSSYLRLYTGNLWDFFLFICYGGLCAAVAMRWMQTYRFGKGHYLAGMAATVFVWMYLPVIFLANGYWLKNLSPLPIIGMLIYMGYNSIYFWNWTQFDIGGSRPTGSFWQDTPFGRYALRDQPEGRSWLMKHYKTTIGIASILVCLVFGFYRSVENFTAGASAAITSTKTVVKAEVSQASKVINQAIVTSTASVTANQADIAEDVASTMQQVDTLKGVAKQAAKKSDEAARYSKRADAKAERAMQSPSLYVYPMHPRVPGGNASERLDVPPKLKGKKTSLLLATDSLERDQMARFTTSEVDENQ